MDEVFLLWHVHDMGTGDEDIRLIGVYGTRQEAETAIEGLGPQSGFADTPERFEIRPYRLDEDNWAEDYSTLVRLLRTSYTAR